MKRCLSVALLTVISAIAICARAQETFRNLDFESAQLIFVPPGVIATSNALPHWSAFGWNMELATVTYNSGGGFFYNPVELIGMGHGEISGYFSALLTRGYSGSDSIGSITQTGLIPVNAQSLVFKATMSVNNALALSLGSQDLSYVPMSNGPNYTLYGADISAFAGQTKTLSFSVAINFGVIQLDDIQFSPFAIPEPSAASLFALSALFFAARRFRGRRGRP